MDRTTISRHLIAILAAAGLLGCSDGPDPSDVTTPVEGEAVMVTIALGIAAPSAGAELMADGGNVPRDAIDAIDVTISQVEVHPAAGGAWIGLDVESGGELDLLGLPAAPDGDPLVIARGELEPGDYTNVRLFLADGGSIELNSEVCLGEGNGPCLAAGSHGIRIPSSEQTGIKTDAGFTIDEGSTDETVMLLFDPAATVGSVVFAPGQEDVMVNPVIRAR